MARQSIYIIWCSPCSIENMQRQLEMTFIKLSSQSMARAIEKKRWIVDLFRLHAHQAIKCNRFVRPDRKSYFHGKSCLFIHFTCLPEYLFNFHVQIYASHRWMYSFAVCVSSACVLNRPGCDNFNWHIIHSSITPSAAAAAALRVPQQIANLRFENWKSNPNERVTENAYIFIQQLDTCTRDSRCAQCPMQWHFFDGLRNDYFWCVSTSKLANRPGRIHFNSIRIHIQMWPKIWTRWCLVCARVICVRPRDHRENGQKYSAKREFDLFSVEGGCLSIGGNQQNEINRFSMFGKIILFLLSSRPSASTWSVYSAHRKL